MAIGWRLPIFKTIAAKDCIFCPSASERHCSRQDLWPRDNAPGPRNPVARLRCAGLFGQCSDGDCRDRPDWHPHPRSACRRPVPSSWRRRGSLALAENDVPADAWLEGNDWPRQPTRLRELAGKRRVTRTRRRSGIGRLELGAGSSSGSPSAPAMATMQQLAGNARTLRPAARWRAPRRA